MTPARPDTSTTPDTHERNRALAVLGRAMWRARLLMTVASLACLMLALGALWISLVDLGHFFGALVDYAGLGADARSTELTELITDIIKILDGFLLCAILVIAALGLYELFVADVTERRTRAARLLEIHDLDDLKERVARLIVLILMIELFGYALRVPITTPIDLLLLAVVVLIVALAIYLTGRRPGRGTRTPASPAPPSHARSASPETPCTDT